MIEGFFMHFAPEVNKPNSKHSAKAPFRTFTSINNNKVIRFVE